MKNKRLMKSSLSMLLCLGMSCSVPAVGALTNLQNVYAEDVVSGTVNNGLKGRLIWTVDNGTLTLDGKGEMRLDHPWTKYDFSEVVFKGSLTTIGDNAFAGNKKITEITITRGVTYIGKGAFSGCPKLERIDIPDTVIKIGETAFSSLNITEIKIPASIAKINERAFQDCGKLVKLELADGLESIG